MDRRNERLGFAVQFVNTDLNHLRAGDALNLRDDLARFLAPTHPDDLADTGSVWATAVPSPQQSSVDTLRELQWLATALLVRVVDLISDDRAWRPFSPSDFLDAPKLVASYRLTRRRRGRLMMEVRGPLPDVFLLTLHHLLAGDEPDRIRRCKCGRLFFRIRKQESCTLKCGKRFAMRRYRQTERAKASNRRHAKRKRLAVKVDAGDSGAFRYTRKKKAPVST
jgi:hypothetical protein